MITHQTVNPYKCHLWFKKNLSPADFKFKTIKTFVDEAHLIRTLLQCEECGQLYFHEFYEEIDWVDGNDPAYRTYIPIAEEKDADIIQQENEWGIHLYSPRLLMDSPQSSGETIKWIRNWTSNSSSLTEKIDRAINKAAELHDGQERKGDGLPYIVHPFAVALILLKYSNDEDVIIAGILHDTIEDTGYTREQMEQEFGQRITQFVLDVTEPPKPLSWQQRKDGYLKHLQGASHEAKLICAADKIHNLQSLLSAVQKFGEQVYQRFSAPITQKLWFYEECLKILKDDQSMPPAMIENIEILLKAIRQEDAFPKVA